MLGEIGKIERVKKIGFIIALGIISFIVIVPFIIMIITSDKTMAEIQAPGFNLLPEKWVFSNYLKAMQVGNWAVYFKNSFLITVIVVCISLFLNSLSGYAFSRLNFPGRDMLFFLSLLGVMIPEQVIMIPVFLKLRSIPLAGGNNIWGDGGIGLLNSYAGLILPFISHPFGVFMCRQFFLNFPVSLDEAAKIDGCSRFRAYFQIYLPLIKPVLATLAILKASVTWNQYTWPLILTNSDAMKTVQLALSNYKTEVSVQWNYLMAATMLISIPVITLFLFLQKYYVEGIATSGIKG